MQPYRLLSADEQPVAPIQAEFANMGNDDQILVEIELKWTDVVLGAVRHVLSWRRSQFIERVRVQVGQRHGGGAGCGVVGRGEDRGGRGLA